MSKCKKCSKSNCNCDDVTLISVQGNYANQAWANDVNGGGFSLSPLKSNGELYPYYGTIR